MAKANSSVNAMMISAVVLISGVLLAQGCIYKYGTEPNALKPHKIEYDYAFAGADWVDASFLTQDPTFTSICTSGKQQSPINVPGEWTDLAEVPESKRTSLNLGKLTSNGTSLQVINNGHTIQVEWSGPTNTPTISVSAPVKSGNSGPVGPLNAQVLRTSHSDPAITWQRLTLYPFQFHFHAHSEHLVDGHMYPIELHIVTQTKPGEVPNCSPTLGCLSVVGIMLEVDVDRKESNPFLDTVFKYMPSRDGAVVNFPAGTVLDFADVVPADQTYVTYEGSLTTPPCSEGILWHVMTTPMKISFAQYQAYLNATGDSDCTLAARRRELLAETKGNYNCTKLGAGQNYRIAQPVLERPLKVFQDPSGAVTFKLPPLDMDYTAFMLDKELVATTTATITATVSSKSGVPESHISVAFLPGSVVPEVTMQVPSGWTVAEFKNMTTTITTQAQSGQLVKPSTLIPVAMAGGSTSSESYYNDMIIAAVIGTVGGVIFGALVGVMVFYFCTKRKVHGQEAAAANYNVAGPEK